MTATASQKAGDALTRGLVSIFSLFMALGVIAVPCFLVWLDLFLGPQFMTAYVEKTGMYSGALADIIPWTASVATTGFQYMLLLSVRSGAKFKGSDREGKTAIAVGWTVLIFDTVIDVSGFTSLFYHDPNQGMQVIPDNPNAGWLLGAIIVAACCGGQEFILSKMLARKKGEKLPFKFPGSFMIKWGRDLVGGVYDIFCGAARGVAVVSVFLLDVFLSKFCFQSWIEGNVTGSALDIISWLLGLALTVGQFMIFMKHKHEKEEGASKKELRSLYFSGLALVIFDTSLDINGFKLMVYGPDAPSFLVFPANADLAWLLLAAAIVAMCTVYESLLVTLFRHALQRAPRGSRG